MRYHSLCVAVPLPPGLEPIAWTPDGVLMALAHATGRSGACSSIRSRSAPSTAAACSRTSATSPSASAAQVRPAAGRALDGRAAAARGRRLASRALRLQVRAPRVAARHRAGVRAPVRRRARTRSGSTAAGGRRPRAVLVHGRRRRPAQRARDLRRRRPRRSGSSAAARPSSAASRSSTTCAASCGRIGGSSDDLPFDLDCGFVGCLGYELKADCGGRRRARVVDARRGAPVRRPAASRSTTSSTARTCSALHRRGRRRAPARRGSRGRAAGCCDLPPLPPLELPAPAAQRAPVEFRSAAPARGYLDDIRRCQRYLSTARATRSA